MTKNPFKKITKEELANEVSESIFNRLISEEFTDLQLAKIHNDLKEKIRVHIVENQISIVNKSHELKNSYEDSALALKKILL